MKKLFLSLTMLVFATTAHAELRTIWWTDLVEQSAQDFEDPYRDLTPDQLDELVTVVRSRQRLEQGSASTEDVPDVEAKLNAAEASLTAAGIDIDWLISQRWVVADKRKAAANAGNPALDQQQVSISGFAIPAPPEPDGASAIYLVEAPGLCSHMPPPPPNQLIKVRLKEAWTPDYIHQPVQLTGLLHVDPTLQSFAIIDGDVAMKATWLLEADSVSELSRAQSATPADSDWVEQLRDKLKANGTISSD